RPARNLAPRAWDRNRPALPDSGASDRRVRLARPRGRVISGFRGARARVSFAADLPGDDGAATGGRLSGGQDVLRWLKRPRTTTAACRAPTTGSVGRRSSSVGPQSAPGQLYWAACASEPVR